MQTTNMYLKNTAVKKRKQNCMKYLLLTPLNTFVYYFSYTVNKLSKLRSRGLLLRGRKLFDDVEALVIIFVHTKLYEKGNLCLIIR